MDLANTPLILEGAISCAQELREIIDGLSAQTIGGSLNRDFIVEACSRVENLEPPACTINLPANFAPASRLPRIVVGALGDTGTGKSKLFNELLGKNVLPTSSTKRATFFPTIIIHHPLPTIEAVVTFMTEEDFAKHVATAIDLLQPNEDGKELTEGSLKKDPSYSLLAESLNLERNHYRGDDGKEVSAAQILAKWPEVEAILGKTENIVVNDEKKFIADTKRRFSRGKGHSQFKSWPLINNMVIKCNADILADGTILVDLPGSSDVSATVLRATASFKDKLQFTLAAARLDRSQTDAALQSNMEDEVARQARTHSSSDAENAETSRTPPQSASAPSASDPALAVIITRCDSTTNVNIEELEAEDDVGSLLREDHAYNGVRERVEAIKLRIEELQEKDEEDAESDLDELTSDDEAEAPPSPTRDRKRSQAEHPEASSPTKRLRTADGVKLEPAGPSASAGAEAMDVDLNLPQLQKRLEACEQQSLVIASGIRSQVICTTIRAQYLEKAKESLKGDIPTLPVFATSAFDFAIFKGDLASGKLTTTAELDRTGIPACRDFIRNIGAREQRAAALRAIQPFIDSIKSVLELLKVKETQDVDATAQQKVALRELWASRAPGDGVSTSTDAVQDISSSASIRTKLKETFEAIVHSEICGVRRKLAQLETACNRPLSDLAYKHVPEISKKIVTLERHQSTWRAFLTHDGVHKGVNWNATLAAPLVASMAPERKALFDHWNKTVVPNLRHKLFHAGVRLLDTVAQSAAEYDPELSQSVNDHVGRAIDLMYAGVHEASRSIAAELLDRDERESRPQALIKAVEKKLVDVYNRALKTTGIGSMEKQKDFLEEAINERAQTMFPPIVKKFVDARRATVDSVHARLLEALNQTATEAELAISPVWASVGRDEEQAATQDRAFKAVAHIRDRLVAMETALKDGIKHAEENVPSCYPPPALPDTE
ncbi:unnamed protein product [Peniophora sp. CBMAI 1063]|nr:unnamed protein product [Peniophora sp. CBMAI 1063]